MHSVEETVIMYLFIPSCMYYHIHVFISFFGQCLFIMCFVVGVKIISL